MNLEKLVPLTSAPVVCPDADSAVTPATNAERQARFRQSAKGIAAAAARKQKRRDAKRKYHSERRAAVVSGAGAGERRVRDVGNNGAPGNAVRVRFMDAGFPVGWFCAWPREVARG
jgi:hypothetical protein